jgi:RNA polymerase sigma-70 factor (ECF subfamily)
MRRIDENAFVAAYDEYAEAIFRYCYFRVYDREKARDLMQETFTRAWEYLRRGNTIDELRPFLYRTAHNVSVNEMVRKRAFSLDEMREVAGFDPTDTERSPEEDAQASLLMDKLQELDDADRELLTMRYMEGLPVKDIAALLDIPPNTASVRIKRAIDTLRRIMGPITPI